MKTGALERWEEAVSSGPEVSGVLPAVRSFACGYVHEKQQHHEKREKHLIHTPISPQVPLSHGHGNTGSLYRTAEPFTG